MSKKAMSRISLLAVSVLVANLCLAMLMYNFVCWHYFRGYNEVSNMVVGPAVTVLVVVNLSLTASIWLKRYVRKQTGMGPIAGAFLLSAVLLAVSPFFAPSIGRFANRRQWITTPLIEAARYGDAAVVMVLLEHGANPNVREPALDTTPLHYMASYGETEAVNRLLEGGANPNAQAFGETPLDWAMRGVASQSTVDALAAHGAIHGERRSN